MASSRFIPYVEALVDAVQRVSNRAWQTFLEGLTSDIATLQNTINAVPGVNYFTIATQPALGPTNVGYVGYEKDTGHYVWFDGTNWQLLGSGDAPGRFEHFAVAAPAVGWVRCDGTVTSYLVVGNPTLTTTAFTTPNLSGTPAYLKDGAYTGTINAKAGSTGTGTTGTGTTGTGTSGSTSPATDAQGAHTHGGATGTWTVSNIASSGTNVGAFPNADGSHSHTISSDGSHSHTVDAHTHSVPGLSVPGLSVPALGVGTIEMPYVAAPIFFRR